MSKVKSSAYLNSDNVQRTSIYLSNNVNNQKDDFDCENIVFTHDESFGNNHKNPIDHEIL